MPSTTARALILVAAIGLVPLAALAQSDCQDAQTAANTGKATANETINNVEQDLKTKVNAARACIEAFGAAGARITILMGGFDLAPIQNMMTQAACSVIQKGASSITPSFTAPVFNLPSPSVKVPTVPTQPAATPGFWESLANSILGLGA